MLDRLTEILEILGIFAIILGVWAVFAYIVASLALFLPGENMIRFVGAGVPTLGLFLAIWVASRLVGKRRARF
jgi:hypothetical protein